MGLFDFFKKKDSTPNEQLGQDYSHIDSQAKVQEVFEKGQLVKLYLIPLDFGGEDNVMNTLFVPQFANELKNHFDSKVYNMLKDGINLGYSAEPEYKGNSFVPSKIVFKTSGDKTITETIDIW